MIYLLGLIILMALGVTIKYFTLFFKMRSKRKRQQIITTQERVVFRNWTIIFVGTISAVVVGFGSALISYL